MYQSQRPSSLGKNLQMQPSPSCKLTRDLYPPEFFHREDETDDRLFYVQPRLVVHIDDHATGAIAGFLEHSLPRNGVILDLMSSWRSHLPKDFPKKRLVGLGLNEVEMAENPQLDDRVVHDLNADSELPFDDAAFDAVMVTVSIQYMVRPVEVFSQVNRVLKESAGFHVIYSNRMFPTKAVAIWRGLDDGGRSRLIASYFDNSAGWKTPQALDIGSRQTHYTDPVYVVTSVKKGQTD